MTKDKVVQCLLISLAYFYFYFFYFHATFNKESFPTNADIMRFFTCVDFIYSLCCEIID